MSADENLREAEAAREQARLAAEKFEAIRQAQEAQHGELPQTPHGRPPEQVPHRAIPVEKLEKAPKPPRGRYDIGSLFRQKKKPKERVKTVRQTRTVFRGSSGVNVRMKNGRVIESSGRLSSELNPAHANRLTHLREQIRAFQNRKELSSLETIWRKTRARYSHDPELRP